MWGTGGSRERPNAMQLYRPVVNESKIKGEFLTLGDSREPPVENSFRPDGALERISRGRLVRAKAAPLEALREFTRSERFQLYGERGRRRGRLRGSEDPFATYAQLKILANRVRCSLSSSKARRTAAKASAKGKMLGVTNRSGSAAPTGCQ